MTLKKLQFPTVPQPITDIFSKVFAVGTSRRTQFSGLSMAALSAFLLLLWSELLEPAWAKVLELPADQQGMAAGAWMLTVGMIAVILVVAVAFIGYRYVMDMLKRGPLVGDVRQPAG